MGDRPIRKPFRCPLTSLTYHCVAPRVPCPPVRSLASTQLLPVHHGNTTLCIKLSESPLPMDWWARARLRSGGLATRQHSASHTDACMDVHRTLLSTPPCQSCAEEDKKKAPLRSSFETFVVYFDDTIRTGGGGEFTCPNLSQQRPPSTAQQVPT